LHKPQKIDDKTMLGLMNHADLVYTMPQNTIAFALDHSGSVFGFLR